MNFNATILGQAIAFFLFVFFCMKYVWKPIINVIEKRQKEIRENLISAEQTKNESKLIKIDAKKELRIAKQKAEKIINEADKKRIQIIEKAKLEAKIEQKKIISQANIEIEIHRKHICKELHKEIANLAILGAEKIIEHSVNTKISNQIVNNLLDEIKKKDSRISLK
ncbi:F0F1 ATP synthase subunit B [Arsenophonus symbiont of Ornithomya chloropus]|uniref:F0F1 ATP synthase subunit B n=1 Tax=Arsenophonus symbiont of Ornithomya chloropus TaxID=634121 RepID=UPI0032B2EC9D